MDWRNGSNLNNRIFHFKGHLVNCVITTLDSVISVCHGHGFKHEIVFTYVSQMERGCKKFHMTLWWAM